MSWADRSFGWIPDPEKKPDEKPDWPLELAHLPLGAPPAASAEHLLGLPFDQGPLGSCVTQSVAKGVAAAHVRAGHAEPPPLSRLALWYLCRADAGTQLFNAGTHIRTAFEVMNKVGFCEERHWPHDVSMGAGAKYRKQPETRALQLMHDQKEGSQPTCYRRIFEVGLDRLERVKQAIANGYPVLFGTDVSREFVDPGPGELPVYPPTGETAGGHAMVIGAYHGDLFRVLNSWGNWNGDGWFTMTADYLMWPNTRDLWTVEVAPWFTG